MDSYMKLKPNLTTIKVIGVGGGGCNAVDRMIEAGIGGVEFIAVNTDAMALAHSVATSKIVIGLDGRGAGGKPDVGQAAADKSRDAIKAHLEGADMVFVASGLGGGTGTGAAPIIAAMARELGALTVSIVTMPFDFEGAHRMRLAKEGLTSLRKESDTLIEIQNDRLKNLVDPNAPLKQAFMVADEMLRQGIQGITDLINITGLINIDFMDVSAIMREWPRGHDDHRQGRRRGTRPGRRTAGHDQPPAQHDAQRCQGRAVQRQGRRGSGPGRGLPGCRDRPQVEPLWMPTSSLAPSSTRP